MALKLQQKKSFQSLLSAKLKKVHKIEQKECGCVCYSNLEFSAETISIQDPCDINEIKDKTSYSPPMVSQFCSKLILAPNLT